MGVSLVAGCADSGDAETAVAPEQPAATAQASALPAGTYRWQLEGGCAELVIGASHSYRWDRGCDGSVNYRARPRIDGDFIRIDMARLNVDSVTDTGFTGRWRLRDHQSDIVAPRG